MLCVDQQLQASWSGSVVGFSLAPALISHHKYGYLRECCSTTPSPSNRQRKPKHKHTTTLQPSYSRYPMVSFLNHDHLVAGIRFHSNSLFNTDVKGLTVLRQVTGRCPATPIYNQCALTVSSTLVEGRYRAQGLNEFSYPIESDRRQRLLRGKHCWSCRSVDIRPESRCWNQCLEDAQIEPTDRFCPLFPASRRINHCCYGNDKLPVTMLG